MSGSLYEAIAKLKGTSPIADALIERRFQGLLQVQSATAASNQKSENVDIESIVDSVLTGDDISNVEAQDLSKVILYLAETVVDLSNTVASMEDELFSLREDYSDIDISNSINGFRESIDGKDVFHLRAFYTKSVLARMKRETRVIIVRELIDYAKSKNKRPADLWVSILETEGSIGE